MANEQVHNVTLPAGVKRPRIPHLFEEPNNVEYGPALNEYSAYCGVEGKVARVR